MQHLSSEPASSSAEGGRAEYGVGVDTELVARWRRLLPGLRAPGHRRLFTEREHEYCESFADPASVYAGHWCAKEAVLKALSPLSGPPLTLDQIEVAHLATGCPVAHLPATWAAETSVQVSISHDAERAVAFAVAVRAPRCPERLAAVVEQLRSLRLG